MGPSPQNILPQFLQKSLARRRGKTLSPRLAFNNLSFENKKIEY